MPPPPRVQGEGPTIWQKMKMGAIMGGGVGLTIGFIFGSWTILRGGAGPRGSLATLSQYMLSSAATFSFFLSIGSVIRSDSILSPRVEALGIQLAAPQLYSRATGFSAMRARWEKEQQRQGFTGRLDT